MEEYDIYRDIRERTGGDVYVGVVGPVRAGKSTFITNFMQKMVMPRVEEKVEADRMRDELPQSANGKVIMTTQPKFVPAEAAEVAITDNVKVKIRFVDCVGYLIEGASGHLDNENKPRMVKTPWSDEALPFDKAAEMGTKKVIDDHSTVGVVMTTDGSIDTEIPRANYVAAEERVVNELKSLNKPFVVILNSTVPESTETQKLADSLSEKYETAVIPLDVANMNEEQITGIFEKLLMEFPLRDVSVDVSKWIKALPSDSEIISSLCATITQKSAEMNKMSDWVKLEEAFVENPYFDGITVENIELGCGKISYFAKAKEGLFYKALSNACGEEIPDEFALMSCIKDFVVAKKEYERLRGALESVKNTGYGVVMPSLDEMTLDQPEIVKQGSRFGVKLKASAPSLHIMEVPVNAEVSPIMGAEQQSEDMVKKMLGSFEGDPKGIWNTEMFGKSMRVLVNEGLNNKIMSMPDEAQKKMRKTLSRIVNEGKGGVICILL